MKKQIAFLSLVCLLSSCNANNQLILNNKINSKGYSYLGVMRQTQGRKGLSQVGKENILVVPVQFKGDASSGYPLSTSDITMIEDIYFGSDDNCISVKDFYSQSSYGKLSISGQVSPKITYTKSMTDLVLEYQTKGIKQVINNIVDYVYDSLFVEDAEYSVKDFDSDKDNNLDGIVISYSWPNSGVFYGTDAYSMVQGLLENETYFKGENNWNANVSCVSWVSAQIPKQTNISYDSHVYITEMGKMLGLETLQDRTGDASGNVRSPLSFMDRMDGYIGDHNPFSKYLLGWATPKTVFTNKLAKEKVVTLRPFESSGDCLLLAPSQTGLFGEYLLVSYYTPDGINEYDLSKKNAYRGTLFDKEGIRVYKVDARLVQGISKDNVSLVEGNVDFSKKYTNQLGQKVNSYIDFAYSNSGVNEYSESGIFENFVLVGELSKKELNRHFVDYTYALDESDMFAEGDVFGGETDTNFYKDYAFNGNGVNGEALGLSFEVTSLGETATLTVRRTA